jgi:hypothetical protein
MYKYIYIDFFFFFIYIFVIRIYICGVQLYLCFCVIFVSYEEDPSNTKWQSTYPVATDPLLEYEQKNNQHQKNNQTSDTSITNTNNNNEVVSDVSTVSNVSSVRNNSISTEYPLPPHLANLSPAAHAAVKARFQTLFNLASSSPVYRPRDPRSPFFDPRTILREDSDILIERAVYERIQEILQDRTLTNGTSFFQLIRNYHFKQIEKNLVKNIVQQFEAEVDDIIKKVEQEEKLKNMKSIETNQNNENHTKIEKNETNKISSKSHSKTNQKRKTK